MVTLWAAFSGVHTLAVRVCGCAALVSRRGSVASAAASSVFGGASSELRSISSAPRVSGTPGVSDLGVRSRYRCASGAERWCSPFESMLAPPARDSLSVWECLVASSCGKRRLRRCVCVT